MKRTFLFMTYVLASVMMYAQEESNEYLPFVDAGKYWFVARSVPGQDAIDEVGYYIPLGMEEINSDGKAYYKMKAFVNNTTEKGTYLIREENRKVYLFDTDTQKEYLMFDYSLKAGDTYEVYSVEYQKMVKYEVLSVGDYTEGPKVSSSYYDEKGDSIAMRYRYLRKWVVVSDIEEELCLEPKVWIEGVGSLEGPFASLYDESCSLDHLAYVHYNCELYLPFTFHESIGKLWFGCNMPTGEEYDYSEDRHHQLTYELEGNRLHVYGKVLTHGGANNYAYFIEEPTDDSTVRKLHFKIQEIEPLPDPSPDSDGLALHTTDFYVGGLPPHFDYIIVDNYGEEHPVINKTPQMAYRPFIEEGKVWKVGGISSGNPVNLVEYYYFDGDTIINGKTCKQMMRQRFVSPDHPDYAIYSRWPSLSYFGAWYEEDKKVYVCREESKEFQKMYDFSLEANDTLKVDGAHLSYVIGPRETGGLKGFKGVYRDIMWAGELKRYNTTWLEGIGNIDGPTYSVYLGKEYHALFLMSCTVGDEVIYLNDEYEDGATPDVLETKKVRFDFTHTVKTQPKAPRRIVAEKSLYGEYNCQQLDINLSSLEDEYMVHITDASGKVVYEKTINAGNIVGLNVDISTFAEGSYIVSVENSRESFVGEFNINTTGIEEVRSKKLEP